MFKQAINNQERVVGIWQTIPSIQLCHTLISSGVDFIIFDMEHSVFNFKDTLEHCLLCKSNNVGAVIRISNADKQLISLAYDVGADVVQIPNMKTVQDVRNVINYMSYSSEKGYSPFTVSENYTGIKSVDKPLISIHIENIEMMDHLDEILEMENVDIYFFGLFDISRSYGLLGDVKNPVIVRDVKLSMRKVKAKNKTVGFIVNNVKDSSDFIEYGNYITYSSDVFLLKSRLSKDINELKSNAYGTRIIK